METIAYDNYGLSSLVSMAAKTALGTQRVKAGRVTCEMTLGQISNFSIHTSGGLIVINPKNASLSTNSTSSGSNFHTILGLSNHNPIIIFLPQTSSIAVRAARITFTGFYIFRNK